jgi:hypothetical protein
VEVVETATPAAEEFLEVLAVFVAVGGLWFGLGFHGVGDLRGIDRTCQNDKKQAFKPDRYQSALPVC